MKIAPGVRVRAAYRFLDEEGGLIESSEGRAPMEYVHGEAGVLHGIQVALTGLEVGARTRVVLAPEQAFGAHRPELVFDAPRANLPPGIDLQPGADLYSGMGDRPAFRLRVLKETANGVLVDGNHPLAGKTLTIDLEVLEILPAQAAGGEPALEEKS